jgi:mono/diheme cytochrome c family protein
MTALSIAGIVAPAGAAESEDGKAILERNCARCHAVSPGAASPLRGAPNLFTVLGSYPDERLEAELSEGIGSRHPTMPQIQFSIEDITSIYYYLHGEQPETKPRRDP